MGVQSTSSQCCHRPDQFCVVLMHITVTVVMKTRMVQLPATAAIEYVAACCRTRTGTRTKTRTKTKIGTITKTVRGPYARSPKFNTYTHRPGFLCLATYRDGQTTKKPKKKTLGHVAPRGVDPALQIFRVCRGRRT